MNGCMILVGAAIGFILFTLAEMFIEKNMHGRK
jgi:hypothetical protein